jgi:hypothetical protein
MKILVESDIIESGLEFESVVQQIASNKLFAKISIGEVNMGEGFNYLFLSCAAVVYENINFLTVKRYFHNMSKLVKITLTVQKYCTITDVNIVKLWLRIGIETLWLN